MRKHIIKCGHLYKNKICNTEICQIMIDDNNDLYSLLICCERCKMYSTIRIIKNNLILTLLEQRRYARHNYIASLDK